jgi:hypothetical protein
MARVFISYRREDSIAYAGRLYDRLHAAFGRHRVFMDFDTIAPGSNFVDTINQRLDSCDVMLVIIGRLWLTASAPDGSRRLDSPQDFVRIEVAAALRRGVVVIPILMGGSSMPEPVHLPEDLRELSGRQAMVISDIGFHDGVDRLIRLLKSPPWKAATIEAWTRPKGLRYLFLFYRPNSRSRDRKGAVLPA